MKYEKKTTTHNTLKFIVIRWLIKITDIEIMIDGQMCFMFLGVFSPCQNSATFIYYNVAFYSTAVFFHKFCGVKRDVNLLLFGCHAQVRCAACLASKYVMHSPFEVALRTEKSPKDETRWK